MSSFKFLALIFCMDAKVCGIPLRTVFSSSTGNYLTSIKALYFFRTKKPGERRRIDSKTAMTLIFRDENVFPRLIYIYILFTKFEVFRVLNNLQREEWYKIMKKHIFFYGRQEICKTLLLAKTFGFERDFLRVSLTRSI